MAIQTSTLERSFRYNSVDLIDPGMQFTAEQVRDFYAPTYPEILNAAIEGPDEKDGKLVYTFRRAVGTKGAINADEAIEISQVTNGFLVRAPWRIQHGNVSTLADQDMLVFRTIAELHVFLDGHFTHRARPTAVDDLGPQPGEIVILPKKP